MSKITEIPEYWDEFTPRQFKYFLKAVFRMISNPDISPRETLLDFADYLLGRRKFFMPLQQNRYLLLAASVADSLEWMFEYDESGNVGVNYNSTVNLIPSIWGWLGPQSHGSDICFGEYRMAVECYNRYTTDHQIDDLNALVGILYRHPSRKKMDAEFDGNYREIFNKHLIEKYANRAKGFPEHLKWGVYLWFSYFCKFIVDGGEFVIEGNDVCFSSIFDRSTPDPDGPPESSIGMLAVLFTLADSGTFGNAQETDRTDLFKILLKLLHDQQSAKQLTKQ